MGDLIENPSPLSRVSRVEPGGGLAHEYMVSILSTALKRRDAHTARNALFIFS